MYGNMHLVSANIGETFLSHAHLEHMGLTEQAKMVIPRERKKCPPNLSIEKIPIEPI